ncbi:kinase-like domain-containing protein [Sporodiniella umbellata]|nr:kinase-like domain-containing protein [Sporodiniella umbellata]
MEDSVNKHTRESKVTQHSHQLPTYFPLNKEEKLYETFTEIQNDTFLRRAKTNSTVPVTVKQVYRRKSLPSYFDALTLRHISSNSTLISSLGGFSSSSSSTVASVEEDNYDEKEDFYVPHLHNRLKHQHQAVLTTHEDFRIIITNSIASDILVGHESDQQEQLEGKQVIKSLIDPSYQNRLKSTIVKRRKAEQIKSDDCDDDTVIISGDIVPIVKLDGTKSSASLWLKEKNGNGSSIFIWIFEEVYESTVTVQVGPKAEICNILDENGLKDLYDHDATDILDLPLTKLIPSLALEDWKNDIVKRRFFGSETNKGACFPVIVRLLDDCTVHITSMPIIAGLINVRPNGVIDNCSQVFMRYLFGYSQEDVLLKKNIADLLPQFPVLFDRLKRDDLLQQGLVINNTICRKLVDPLKFENDRSRLLTHTPNNLPLPLLIGLHRDNMPFEIQLQIQLEEESNIYSLWISFDRELTFKRYGHQHIISLPPPPPRDSPALTKHKQTEKTYQVLYSAQQPNAVSIDDYTILSEVGQGAYGLVKLAIKSDDSEQKKVVIKYVIKSRILADCWIEDQVLGTIPIEIHILHTLKSIPHDNINKMLDYFEDDDHYYIVMEYRETMDLFDYIEYNERTDEANIRRIFKQLALGIQHLHTHGIVHRDIKDENAVVDKELNAQLIDFGSAAHLNGDRKYDNFVGTLDYAAPEVLKGNTYSGKPQDVWALGILLFTLIYRENPFYDIDEIMTRELRIPFVMSKDSVGLIRQMLERDIEKRIDIHKVIAHSWLN